MTIPTIETERLRLRAWEDRDLDPYAALCADPEVMRFLGGPHTREQTVAAITMMRDRWTSQGFGLFCVAGREDDVCLGFTGLHVPDFLPEVLPAVEIGWRLARAAWDRGYATARGRRLRVRSDRARPPRQHRPARERRLDQRDAQARHDPGTYDRPPGAGW